MSAAATLPQPAVAERTAGCSECSSATEADLRMQAAQAKWRATPVRARLRVLRTARHAMAAQAEAFAGAISPALQRTGADTLASELMPLLDACRFLERNAERLLKPHRLGTRGRPLWLTGVAAEIHREPLGRVLVIAPANFPLFLPGVQTLQALAAGNAVVWKPGEGGRAIAERVAATLEASGLPRGLLRVTDESVAAGEDALAARPDKVVFTGSSNTGRTVLHTLAETATPSVMELSGADAIVVLAGADLRTVARAAAFGLRLNGGAVCMSPRRLIATAAVLRQLRPLLLQELAHIPPVPLDARTASRLADLLHQATTAGAELLGEFRPAAQRPLLLDRAQPTMAVTRSDVFAPVLSLLEVGTAAEIPETDAACPYGLTAAIFCARGDEAGARALAATLRAGTILINDVIAPTADPRVPFGGRGGSGSGVTRGAEGLLEMTAVKVLLVRRGGTMRHLDPTRDTDVPLLAALVRTVHGASWSERWRALRAVAKAGRARK